MGVKTFTNFVTEKEVERQVQGLLGEMEVDGVEMDYEVGERIEYLVARRELGGGENEVQILIGRPE